MSPFVCNHDGSCENIRLCCIDTEMTLTKEDVKRISKIGYKPKKYLVKSDDGFCELKNVDGHCFFYDPETKLCKIYEHRPEGCRYYPIVYHYGKKKCVTDGDCPSRETVERDEIRKVCHRVRNLVRTLREEAAYGESPC